MWVLGYILSWRKKNARNIKSSTPLYAEARILCTLTWQQAPMNKQPDLLQNKHAPQNSYQTRSGMVTVAECYVGSDFEKSPRLTRPSVQAAATASLTVAIQPLPITSKESVHYCTRMTSLAVEKFFFMSAKSGSL